VANAGHRPAQIQGGLTPGGDPRSGGENGDERSVRAL
jgi:hypothetical protein